MNIKPIGNRILIKRNTDEQKTKTGIILANDYSNGANVWGEIVSLPLTDNPNIRQMKVGGRVLYKQFAADKAGDAVDNFEVLEVEPESGCRQGQVLAYEPPSL